MTIHHKILAGASRTILVLLFPFILWAAELSGQVVGVIDGDTIEVLHNQHAERVRFYGIDCPEKGQAYEKKPRQAASTLMFGKEVTVRTHGRDKYGRTIGDLLLGEKRT